MDIFAYTFGVSRLALNVVSRQREPLLGTSLTFYDLQTAAAKGLVAGNFIIKRVDGTQAWRKPDKVCMPLSVRYR